MMTKNMSFIKLFTLILVGMIMSASGAQSAELNFAALIRETSNPYWKTIQDGLNDAARSHEINMQVYALKNIMDAEEQLNQCEAAILKQPKVIIFAAVNNASLASCLKKAQKSGVILVDIDGNIDEKIAQHLGLKVNFSVASNNYELGKDAATYLQKLKNSAAESVLVIEGASISETNKLRVKGFTENLPHNLKIIASQSADWDRLKAADIVNRIILQHPETSIIFATNDTMALGAVEALGPLKRADITVVGVDGTKDAVNAIKSGKLKASVAQFPYLMAKKSVELALSQINDNTPLPFQQNVPVMVLDADILTHKDEALLQYMR